MPPSSAEREIRLLRAGQQLQKIAETRIDDLGLTLLASYDPEDDALVVEFGLREPTFDLPEPDGRMIWRIGYQSRSVAGFTLLLAKKSGVHAVRVDLGARIESIERGIRNTPAAAASGRATRVLIENVAVTATQRQPKPLTPSPLALALEKAMTESERHLQHQGA
jgi:hypothetical protein